MLKLCLGVWIVLTSYVCLVSASIPDFTAPGLPSFESKADHKRYHNQRLIVKHSPKFKHLDLQPVSKRLGVSTLSVKPGKQLKAILQELHEHPDVNYVTKDNVYWISSEQPNDPGYRFQWALPRVGAVNAWDIASKATGDKSLDVNSKRVTICVTDSGIDATHPDLQNNVNSAVGYNVIDNTTNPKDGLSHGTHVAGIIAAQFNNNEDIVGVGGNQVDVLSCKFINDNGYGYSSNAIACIDYCIDMGADIITNSWSGNEPNDAVFDAIKEAGDAGILFVVAAGNLGHDVDTIAAYPAAYGKDLPNMLVVASTAFNSTLSSFSNYGKKTVHIAAPGEWILSTIPDNKTAYYSGTSMAAPLVAGAAGLIKSATNGELSAIEIKKLILNTAEQLPSLQGKLQTEGELRVDKALMAALKLVEKRHQSIQATRRKGRKLMEFVYGI